MRKCTGPEIEKSTSKLEVTIGILTAIALSAVAFFFFSKDLPAFDVLKICLGTATGCP